MARTAVPITALLANSEIANPAGTAVDPTNDHVIAAGGKTDRLWIRCTNTSAGAKTLTVVKGVNPPAVRGGIGDLVVSIPATTGDRLVGPLESARFAQANGDIYVDLEAAITGIIAAFRLPKV
jgi:hypothetical protein